MAPGRRSAPNLSEQLASLHEADTLNSDMTMSDKEKQRTLAANNAPVDKMDDLSKQLATIASQGEDNVMTALAALSKDKQNAIMARFSNDLDKLASCGDHSAEMLAIVYQGQLDYLYPKTNSYERVLQRSAKIARELGLAERDIQEEKKKSHRPLWRSSWATGRNCAQS